MIFVIQSNKMTSRLLVILGIFERIDYMFSYYLHKLRVLKLRKNIKLWGGDNIYIMPHFDIGGSENLSLYNHIHLGKNAFINATGGVDILSGTVVGPYVTIYSVNHIYDNAKKIPFDDEIDRRKVVIGENCWLGSHVFICPGVELGEGCVVAAGAVVTKSFPPLSVIGGNPARIIKIRDQKVYEKVKESAMYCTGLLK